MFRTPHVSIRDENPVFDFELRRVRRLAMPGRLWVYSALLQVVPLLVTMVVYFASVWDYVIRYGVTSGYSGPYYRYYSDFYSAWSIFGVVTLVASGLMAFFGGIYYMSVSIHSINTQINNGHWDMLRLTPLGNLTVLRAKEAIAHIRAWRLMHIEIALRIVQVTLVGLLLFFQPDEIAQGRWLNEFGTLSQILGDLIRRPLLTLTQCTLILTIACVWIIEPRWRMRTITTMGLALSARVHNVSMASVMAFFGLFGFHLAQAALLSGTVWLIAGLWRVYYLSVYSRNDYDDNLFVFGQAASILSFLWIAYLIYWAGRRLSWHSALRQAFKAER
jgi:hypothetical protein